MIVNVTSVDYTVTESMLEYVSKKISCAASFSSNGIIEVCFIKENKTHKVKIDTIVKGEKVKVEVEDEDLYKAIDMAAHIFKENSIKQSKKMTSLKRRSIKSFNYYDSYVNKISEENKKSIKRKTVSSKPMYEEEAILQMEAFNYQSFLFYNMSTKTPCMLYKKNENEYVLVDTELKIHDNTNYVFMK